MQTPVYKINVYKLSLVRDSSVVGQPNLMSPVTRSLDAASLLRTYLEGTDREHFVVLLLNRKNKVIGINTVSMGSLTASVVHPREVFKPAILANAAALICGHNHPSGDPAPSAEDRALTARLVTAGQILGIQILDHVIIGDTTHYSFMDSGALEALSA